jgi:hypothetical protein
MEKNTFTIHGTFVKILTTCEVKVNSETEPRMMKLTEFQPSGLKNNTLTLVDLDKMKDLKLNTPIHIEAVRSGDFLYAKEFDYEL